MTLNLGTPLEWLERDHEKADKPQPVPMHLGAWLPILKKSRFSNAGTRASVFGPVPLDGGDALIFLKKYRGLIEGHAEPYKMRSGLMQLQSEYQELVSRVTDDLLAYYFREQLQFDLRCGPRTARKLYDAGYINSAKVRSARSEDLLSISSVDQKTISRFSETSTNQKYPGGGCARRRGQRPQPRSKIAGKHPYPLCSPPRHAGNQPSPKPGPRPDLRGSHRR